MEIEIVTTKKKLTKSIINQMPMDTFKFLEMLPTGTLIGKLVNVRKGVHTVYLVKFGFGYALIADTFYPANLGIRDKKSLGSIKKFDSAEDFEEYFQTITDLRRKCVQIYI